MGKGGQCREGAEMEALGFLWLLLLLDLPSSGTAKIPAPDPLPHQVSGIQGGSVSLPVFISRSKSVAKIEWKFQPPAGLALIIAEFRNGALERLNPADRFGQRLEMAGEATLRITSLELGDQGIYRARVRLASAMVEEHSFSCRVYGPVPEPQIRHQVSSKTAERCNVTLQCLVSGQEGIDISWKMGEQQSVLEESSDWHRLSARGTLLHVSWRPSSSSATFTCLVKNPAEQKKVSLDLLSLCQTESTGRNPAKNPPLQVNGILGRSVVFPLNLPPAKTVARIEWLFQAASSPGILIATFKDGKLERPNTSDRFGLRLEMADETTLRIRALEKEDGGILIVCLLFANAEIHKQTFHLSVFEPLPDPQIRPRLTSKTAEACNVTLECLASEQGRFNISWKSGDQNGTLEEGSDWYQPSAEGTDLHVSWQPSSSHSTFTCLLSSPADRKNVSFDLLSICQSEEAFGCLSWVRVAMLIGLLVQIITVTSLNILERMGQKEN